MGHLVGTNLLRAYMHGFFMHNKLWQKAKSIAAPVDYATVRKERIQSKMEADRAQRITLKRKLPKVEVPTYLPSQYYRKRIPLESVITNMHSPDHGGLNHRQYSFPPWMSKLHLGALVGVSPIISQGFSMLASISPKFDCCFSSVLPVSCFNCYSIRLGCR